MRKLVLLLLARAGRRPATHAAVVLVALLAVFLSLPATPARAGQIVYRHGSDIWTMNDDGSNQRPLLTAGQVPGMSSIAAPAAFPDGGTEVAFEGTTLAYAAPAGSGPAGSCGLECTGVYTFDHGALVRLTPAAAPCGQTPQWCGSFSTSPSWTANGEIAYEYTQFTWEYSCLYVPCGWSFTSALEEIHTMPPAPSGGLGPQWSVGHAGTGAKLAPIPDPTDPGKLAYIGAYVECGSGSGCLDPLYTSSGDGTDTPVVYDDNLLEAAWSPDGARFADVEGGGERGIWTYAADAADTPGKQFVWALRDPIQTGADPGANPNDVTFEGVAWRGAGAILFSADDNLWTIPASCGAGGTPCEFPGDATQLTTDGSAAAPDEDPSWTSATASLSPPPAPAPAPGASSPPPATGASQARPGKRAEAARPRVSAGSLGGVSRRRARLSFTLAGGASRLRKIAVKLPRGLDFARSPKRLRAGISLRDDGGKKLKFAALVSHGVLSVTLKKPAGEVRMAIGRPALTVRPSLARQVKAGKVDKLRVTVSAIGTDRKTTRVTFAPHAK